MLTLYFSMFLLDPPENIIKRLVFRGTTGNISKKRINMIWLDFDSVANRLKSA